MRGGREQEVVVVAEEVEVEEVERRSKRWSCSNRFLPAYSARSPSLLHPSRFLFRFNRLCFHFVAVGLF
jgi:hypothetical protein